MTSSEFLSKKQEIELKAAQQIEQLKKELVASLNPKFKIGDLIKCPITREVIRIQKITVSSHLIDNHFETYSLYYSGEKLTIAGKSFKHPRVSGMFESDAIKF